MSRFRPRGVVGSTEASQISNVAWWDQFRDPALSDLVRTSLANNMDVKVATARVEQAAAQYGIVRSAQLPQVDANASAARQGVSQTTAPGVPAGRHVSNSYGINSVAAFELDVWGKLRRAAESAQASLLASEQGKGRSC
jgi:multidrug efflux system outer membrane protein